ncbi:MAG: DUF6088 family protein [Actinomycetota bacterium]
MVSVSSSIAAKIKGAPTGTFFETSDLATLGRAAAETSLSRIADRGDIVRVRRGLYWKGPKSRFGAGAPSPLAVALKLCAERGVGPTGWSAAAALGVTTQVPATPELVVVGQVPTGIQGIRFRSRSNHRRIGLRYLEVALLELLRPPDIGEVSFDALRGRVEALVDDKQIRWDRVRKAAEREPARAGERLRLIAPPAMGDTA